MAPARAPRGLLRNSAPSSELEALPADRDALRSLSVFSPHFFCCRSRQCLKCFAPPPPPLPRGRGGGGGGREYSNTADRTEQNTEHWSHESYRVCCWRERVVSSHQYGKRISLSKWQFGVAVIEYSYSKTLVSSFIRLLDYCGTSIYSLNSLAL